MSSSPSLAASIHHFNYSQASHLGSRFSHRKDLIFLCKDVDKAWLPGMKTCSPLWYTRIMAPQQGRVDRRGSPQCRGVRPR